MNPNARQRHPEIWTAAYGAAFVDYVRTELSDGQSFARSIADTKRLAASACFDIADAAVEAYEDELDRIAGPGASR